MISVIIPVYNEAENLKSFYPRLAKVMDKSGEDHELIFVDDNSSDDSYLLLKGFAKKSARVKLIRFCRNFGQTLAIQAGIDNAKDGLLVMMDADLQNDPEDIPLLLAKIRQGYDAVSGWRRNRKDPLFAKKIPSYLANKLIGFLFGVKIHDLGCGLKAYKKDVFKGLRLYGEMHRLLPVYLATRGVTIAEVEVSHNHRSSGKSHYGWSRIFKVSLDLVTLRFFDSYATKPIYFFGGFGLALIFFGAVVGITVIIRTVFFAGVWISPLLFISLMFFTMGMMLVLMGLMAEIIIRIYYGPGLENNQPYQIREIFQENTQ
jgi:glycosyltransferase involved in cell wall biosynthesis